MDPLNRNTSPVTPPCIISLLLVRRKEGPLKSRQVKEVGVWTDL